MFTLKLTAVCFSLLSLVSADDILPRGIPANATGVTTIVSPAGAAVRFKQPGKEGICETTEGVNDYAGYVDLDNSTHMFFWFFEARNNPATAPLTLWLNGGPGSDSLIGLFQELGPCNINLTTNQTEVNPFSWSEVSNMLFLSQPVGVGFSYAEEELAAFNETTGRTETPTADNPANGRFSVVNPLTFDTTDLAAAGTWHILQAFIANLGTLDPTIKIQKFNLWTESYGGHYGPAFYSYFTDHNAAIANGTENGTTLIMDTLGIGNGIIDETIQAPFYPDFAVNNTYGIKSINDTIYSQALNAYFMPNGCKDQVADCAAADRTTQQGENICRNATNICRGQVEGPYYEFGGRGVYDIRHPMDDPTPPPNFIDYLNTAPVQQALGVNLNYTADASNLVGQGFSESGDFVYPQFITDLESILNSGVRVALYYGDADYICNWFGGEAVSLAVNYTHSEQFRAADYAPFMVNGTEYGEVRQYGNFSFLRVYESGHEVPFYQPIAALEMFRRVLGNMVLADGSEAVTDTYSTNGTAEATHTEPFVALPSETGSSSSASVEGTPTPTPSGSGTGSAASPTPSGSGAKRRARPLWF